MIINSGLYLPQQGFLPASLQRSKRNFNNIADYSGVKLFKVILTAAPVSCTNVFVAIMLKRVKLRQIMIILNDLTPCSIFPRLQKKFTIKPSQVSH